MYVANYKIKFTQSDPGGIIFFSKLFEIAHWAYEEMVENFELKRNYFFDSEFAIPLIHAEADYLKPIRVHEDIRVNVVVEEIRTSSFILGYEFIDAEGDLKAKVKTVHVCVVKNNFSKTSIPDDLKNCLRIHSV